MILPRSVTQEKSVNKYVLAFSREVKTTAHQVGKANDTAMYLAADISRKKLSCWFWRNVDNPSRLWHVKKTSSNLILECPLMGYDVEVLGQPFF